MKPERIRDPIHGLIVFDDDGLVHESAWEWLNTPEAQRLRRIKQLGVSEYVFPSASHTRLSHSIGVYHNARRLVGILKREIELKRVEGEFNETRAKVALFAAFSRYRARPLQPRLRGSTKSIGRGTIHRCSAETKDSKSGRSGYRPRFGCASLISFFAACERGQT